jgi:hypothetical protein
MSPFARLHALVNVDGSPFLPTVHARKHLAPKRAQTRAEKPGACPGGRYRLSGKIMLKQTMSCSAMAIHPELIAL